VAKNYGFDYSKIARMSWYDFNFHILALKRERDAQKVHEDGREPV